MSCSPNSVFRLDPPQPFAYTDWVIKIPTPLVPQGMSAETAKEKYKTQRLKRLIKAVETRVGRYRCFYTECHSGSQSLPSQIEVTKLYAIHEVGHWLGAFAQLEWTSFVMANMEYDATRREYGRDANITCISPLP